jgi:hypothetical protein
MVLLFVLGLLVLSACDQDAIFFAISQEPELRDPQITGSPTNIVKWNDGSADAIYVANRKAVHKYTESGWADSLPNPGGQIWGLAATDIPTSRRLFVLTSGVVKEYDGATSTWKSIANASAFPKVHTIYADSGSGQLFAGAGDGSNSADSKNYAILYLDGADTLQTLQAGVHILTGAAYDGDTSYLTGQYYLSTAGSGVFITNASLSTPSLAAGTGDDKNNISGIIAFDDNGSDTDPRTVIAVRRDGQILLYDPLTPSFVEKGKLDTENSYEATGALAVWSVPGLSDPPALLLAGIQGSKSSLEQNNTNGYREIELSGLPSLSSHAPGSGTYTSINNEDKYSSSLGKYPIKYMYQIPYGVFAGDEMTVFASTIIQGLWSYRDHGDGEVIWNAE